MAELILSANKVSCFVIHQNEVPDSVSFEGAKINGNIIEHADNIDIFFNFDLFTEMVDTDSVSPYLYDVSVLHKSKPVYFFIVSGGDNQLDNVLFPGLSSERKAFLRGTFENLFRLWMEYKKLPQSFYEKLSAANASWFLFVLSEYLA